MMPATIHAAKTSCTEPTARAISLGTRKIPVPIVSLITIAVAARSVSPPTSPPPCDCDNSLCAESIFEDVMERSEAYYRAPPRSMRCLGSAGILPAVFAQIGHPALCQEPPVTSSAHAHFPV